MTDEHKQPFIGNSSANFQIPFSVSTNNANMFITPNKQKLTRPSTSPITSAELSQSKLTNPLAKYDETLLSREDLKILNENQIVSRKNNTFNHCTRLHVYRQYRNIEYCPVICCLLQLKMFF